MDIVAHEAGDDLTKPWARDVTEWLTKGTGSWQQPAGAGREDENREAYRLARQTDPEFKMRDAGDRAIRDWLVEALPEISGPALVIYEDKRLPRLIQREPLDEVVVMATARAILTFAEERGLIASAEEARNDIVKRAEGANPKLDVKVMRPTHAP